MQLGHCWSQFKKSQTPQQLILLISFCLAHSQVSHCEIRRWHVGMSVRTGKVQLWMTSTPVKNVFSAVDASWICRDSIKAILKRGMGGVGEVFSVRKLRVVFIFSNFISWYNRRYCLYLQNLVCFYSKTMRATMVHDLCTFRLLILIHFLQT